MLKEAGGKALPCERRFEKRMVLGGVFFKSF